MYLGEFWFADAFLSFTGVTFVLFCFVSVFLLSLELLSFVLSFLDMHTPRQLTYYAIIMLITACVLFCFLSFLFHRRFRFFRVFFTTLQFYLCMETIVVVCTLKTVLTSIKYLLFLTLQGNRLLNPLAEVVLQVSPVLAFFHR